MDFEVLEWEIFWAWFGDFICLIYLGNFLYCRVDLDIKLHVPVF